MKNPNRYNRDEAIWYAHKVICAYYDGGITPTVAHLRDNWQANHYKDVSDEWLNGLIERVGQFYK